MFKNILKVTFRNMLKNKINSLIIIFGLSTGIVCTILSFLFISDEFSFDRFHKNLKNIYEVKMVLSLPFGRAIADPKASVATELSRQFHEVIHAVRMEKREITARSNNTYYEEDTLFSDPSFLDMFSFPLKHGEAKADLLNQDSIIISESTARKYFGKEDPVGQTLALRLDEEFFDFTVTGILYKIPDSSSLDFDILINLEKLYGASLNDSQTKTSMACFIQLENGILSTELQEKFKATIDRPLQEKYSKESGYVLAPLADFHLQGEFSSYVLEQKSTIKYSLILAAIALLVMVIACFNFMNLSVGRASTRIKEIGVRKVLGAMRRQLIRQFWSESLMYSFISLITGLVIVELCLPAFNQISHKNLSLNLFSNGWIVILFVGVVFFVGIAAGSYPAFVLSKFSSVDLFRRKMKISGKGTFNRSLIVFQFGISIFLIISTAFLFKQKSFMLNMSLGYDTDQVIVLPLKNLTSSFAKKSMFVEALKNKLLQYEIIQGVSGSNSGFPEGWMGTYFETTSGEQSLVVYNYADQDFLPTLGMKLIEGRNFSEDFPSDEEGSVIINESFAKMLGTESKTGHYLSEFFNTNFNRQIIGVVKDFHYESLHDPILPAFIGMSGMDFEYVFVKVDGGRLREAIATLREEFSALAPQTLFEFSFLDEDVARQYEREELWVRMVEYASIFAILIACSGLLGLTLQIIFLRTKEIGIRRVLGASIRHIILLINREFLWLVVAANVLAWPAAYFTMSAVLKNYAFRIALSFWIFLISGAAALLLAFITVSTHTLRAARINPSKTLKYE